MQHPNAFAAFLTTAAAAGIVKVLHHYGYGNITNEEALIATGGAASFVLFLGRRVWTIGLVGVARGLFYGARRTAVGAPPPPPTLVPPPPAPPPPPPAA